MRHLCADHGRARRRAAALVVCIVGTMGLSACASHRLATDRTSVDRHSEHPPPPESLASYIARVRALSAAASRRPSVMAVTLESWDPQLSAALRELALTPTAEQHRRVAREYRRLGVLDKAHAHLSLAVRLDPNDAAAFDARARIWRDWGFANLGFADAYRAVRLAPLSAVAANTLATLFEATGRTRDARRWYQHALELDPSAPFALNNLCYGGIMAKEPDAVTACRRALAAAPDSRIARNNLGLAFAAEGNFDQARAQFENSRDPAAEHYNMGVTYLARRQYRKAVQAFEAALKTNPRFTLAARRASQARAKASAEEEHRDGD